MGLLVEGVWHDRWYDTAATKGRFVRKDSAFRNWVTVDGKAGPTGKAGFKAEPGRYHLYASLACPWAHRSLIFRKLKGLESAIGLSVVHPEMLDQGWSFGQYPGTIPDPVMGAEFLHQLYTAADPKYTGRVTVPVLWDKQSATIVSNESSEIIRMFNEGFREMATLEYDFYPKPLRDEIDEINSVVYHKVNNGVYKAGFATTQTAYEEAVMPLFDTLQWLDERLAKLRYLCGSGITEADWRLFTTLVRFDPVYVGHFKCNIKRIEELEHLPGYLRELYQIPGIAETVNLDHIKRHYYYSHPTINPTRIVPLGPRLDFSRPHGRGHLEAVPMA